MSPATHHYSIEDIVLRPFDIISREEVRAKEAIQAEEDRNIFAALNAVVIESEKREAELEKLRENKIVKTAIMQLELE